MTDTSKSGRPSTTPAPPDDRTTIYDKIIRDFLDGKIDGPRTARRLVDVYRLRRDAKDAA